MTKNNCFLYQFAIFVSVNSQNSELNSQKYIISISLWISNCVIVFKIEIMRQKEIKSLFSLFQEKFIIKKYFFVCPIRLPVFSFFYNEPELGVGNDPGT